jgi:hypothetical protein
MTAMRTPAQQMAQHRHLFDPVCNAMHTVWGWHVGWLTAASGVVHSLLRSGRPRVRLCRTGHVTPGRVAAATETVADATGVKRRDLESVR